jgi:hypothetical protein
MKMWASEKEMFLLLFTNTLVNKLTPFLNILNLGRGNKKAHTQTNIQLGFKIIVYLCLSSIKFEFFESFSHHHVLPQVNIS